jgi:hypothetical protein
MMVLTRLRFYEPAGLIRNCIGRVERRRDWFRPMASSVSALSSIVAYGHQVLPTFPPPPLFIPYDGFSPLRCGAQHFTGYVARDKMWPKAPARPYLLAFPDFLGHILFRPRKSSPTSFGGNRAGVFKYLFPLAVVFSRHADGPLVGDRKAF